MRSALLERDVDRFEGGRTSSARRPCCPQASILSILQLLHASRTKVERSPFQAGTPRLRVASFHLSFIPARFFQISFHLPERLTDPSANGLFSPSMPNTNLGTRFTVDETRYDHIAQLRG